MELINNTSNITNIVPKVIEYPEHFVINTQLYDKQTLKPIPLKFHIPNSLVPAMLLQTSLIRTNYYAQTLNLPQINNEHNHQNIIQDKNDPSIFYVLQAVNDTSGYNFQRHLIYKIQYNASDKTYKTLATFSCGNAGNSYNSKGDIRILYDSGDFFVLSIVTQDNSYYNSSRYYACISLLNKKTFQYHRIYASAAMSFLLEANNDDIYILTTSNFHTRQIIKINLSSKTYKVLWTDTPTTTVTIFCNPVKIGEYYYTLAAYTENSIYSYKIMKIAIDTTTDAVNTELLDIDYNNYLLDSSTDQKMSYSYYINYTLRLIETDNDKYFSLLMHSYPSDVSEGQAYHYQCKHVLLKMNDTSFKVTDFIPLKDGCYGSLENGDSKHQVFYMKQCVLFYVFDQTKEKMINTYQKPGLFMQIGFDSLNRFIVQTSDKTVEILTDTNACTLVADFAAELYDKNNTSEVDTTVSFYAKNFSDEFLETSVKLTLTGPVVFKENKTKELVISTLKTGMRTVPVTITGYGNIQVIITQNT